MENQPILASYNRDNRAYSTMNTNRHLDAARLEYLNRQKKMYEQMKPELVDRYLGEFIAFEDGLVLDRDLIERDLVERVYGYRDLLIKQVWVK